MFSTKSASMNGSLETQNVRTAKQTKGMNKYSNQGSSPLLLQTILTIGDDKNRANIRYLWICDII